MFNFLNALKGESNLTTTENGGTAYRSSESFCLDMFFKAGAMRHSDAQAIVDTVTRAYAEDPDKTMKIVFFARDARGGLGERRFFRYAVSTLVDIAPESVRKNIPLFAEYGRYDDLLVLLCTPLEKDVVKEIKTRLDEDKKSMAEGGKVSLLAKWMPSVNASSKTTRNIGRYLASLLGMSEPEYRKTLSALRSYTDILENRLRERDYTFDYEIQPSCAMLKYRKAFIRNDGKRYSTFLNKVIAGEAKINTGRLYPYDIVRAALNRNHDSSERKSLDVSWNNLPDLTSAKNENAIAVIDGSGSMTWCHSGGIRPIDAALSLGIYFAEHSKGAFANHFITFSMNPKLVEIKGCDIVEKVRYCASYNECANTNLEAVFLLILNTAIKNKATQSEMPSKLYIISDMQFDSCIIGGNDEPMFREMAALYRKNGYVLPEIVFWNVANRSDVIPVSKSENGAALVSGYTPSIFDMVISGEATPEAIMDKILSSERYEPVSA